MQRNSSLNRLVEEYSLSRERGYDTLTPDIDTDRGGR